MYATMQPGMGFNPQAVHTVWPPGQLEGNDMTEADVRRARELHDRIEAAGGIDAFARVLTDVPDRPTRHDPYVFALERGERYRRPNVYHIMAPTGSYRYEILRRIINAFQVQWPNYDMPNMLR
jgi:hypothetical protein